MGKQTVHPHVQRDVDHLGARAFLGGAINFTLCIEVPMESKHLQVPHLHRCHHAYSSRTALMRGLWNHGRFCANRPSVVPNFLLFPFDHKSLIVTHLSFPLWYSKVGACHPSSRGGMKRLPIEAIF